MAVIQWPSTLPQVPQKGFQETVGINVVRSPTDAGPAKQRRRASRPNEMTLSFIMTTAQTQTLESFIKDTINGISRFQFPHPRLLGTTVDVRVVPGSGGEFFNLQYLAPGYWSTSLKLEVMP
jgi:hypothetical protein